MVSQSIDLSDGHPQLVTNRSPLTRPEPTQSLDHMGMRKNVVSRVTSHVPVASRYNGRVSLSKCCRHEYYPLYSSYTKQHKTRIYIRKGGGVFSSFQHSTAEMDQAQRKLQGMLA